MKMILSIVCGFVTWSAWADMPEILSYSELSKLSEAKRMAYVRDVRIMLADLEVMMNDNLSHDGKTASLMSEIKDLLARVENQSTAYAADARPVRRPIIPYRRSNNRNGESRIEWSCAGLGDNLKFDAAVGTCVHSSLDWQGPAYGKAYPDCPSGFTPVYVREFGTVRMKCGHNESLSKMGEREAFLKKGSDQPAAALTAADLNSEKTAASVVVGGLSEQDRKFVMSNYEDGVQDKLLPSQTQAALNSIPIPNAPEPLTTVQGKDGKPQLGTVAVADASCQTVPACKPPENAKKRRELRAALGENAFCVIGGNISTYRGAARPGACQPVNDWPVGSGKPACKEPNTVMCNPAVFCVDPTSKEPMCERNSSSITAKCNERHQRLFTQGKKCDDVLKGTSAQADWNTLSAKFKTMAEDWCGGKGSTDNKARKEAFRNLFCNECTMMLARIGAANQAAAGQACAKPSAAAEPKKDKPSDGVN